MVPSPLPANKSLSREEADRLITAADPNVLAAREHRLALFTEFALDASVCPLRDLLAELSDSSLAVDAITVHTSARGREPRGSELSTDSDAGWYVREGDHRDPDTASAADVIRPPQKAGSGQPTARESRKPSLKKRAKYLLGYDAAFAVTRDAPYDDVLVDDNTTSSVSSGDSGRDLGGGDLVLPLHAATADRRDPGPVRRPHRPRDLDPAHRGPHSSPPGVQGAREQRGAISV